MKINFNVIGFLRKIRILRARRIHFDTICNSLKKEGFSVTKRVKNGAYLSNGTLNIFVDLIYPWIAREVFVDKIYKFKHNFDDKKQYVVFDIGANKGYASLYFAQFDWCKRIFAFELCDETTQKARDNLALNPKLASKIFMYDFGLGGGDGEIASYYLPNRDGISSMNKEFLDNYAPEEEANLVVKKYQIRQASTILKEIIEKYKINNIILKIDVEGAEYEIFEDLVKNYPEIFDKIGIILGETHLGFERFTNIIKNFDFEIVSTEPHSNGTCPFEMINKALIQESHYD